MATITGLSYEQFLKNYKIADSYPLTITGTLIAMKKLLSIAPATIKDPVNNKVYKPVKILTDAIMTLDFYKEFKRQFFFNLKWYYQTSLSNQVNKDLALLFIKQANEIRIFEEKFKVMGVLVENKINDVLENEKMELAVSGAPMVLGIAGAIALIVGLYQTPAILKWMLNNKALNFDIETQNIVRQMNSEGKTQPQISSFIKQRNAVNKNVLSNPENYINKNWIEETGDLLKDITEKPKGLAIMAGIGLLAFFMLKRK